MDGMEEQLLIHIYNLFPILHSTCQAINLTYQVLDVNCYEHQNVLKRWILPVKEESYECTCTTYLEVPEDVVNDIECAVERAKNTRKTMMKVAAKKFSRSSVTNSTVENLEPNYFKDTEKGKANDLNNEKCMIKSLGNKSNVGERDVHTHHVKQRQSRLSTNIKKIKVNTFRTTYQKDFFIRNSQKTSQTIPSKMKHPVKPHATTVDIKLDDTVNVDHLLERVSTGVHKTSDEKIDFFQKVKSNYCLMHGEKTLPIVHRCVNLSEAMNTLGAPPELVKLLKTYHQYVNVADKLQLKRKCSKESFLKKLNESNQCGWHHAASEPIIKLYLHYLLVFDEIISKKKLELSGINLHELEEEFDLLSQSYNKILDFNEQLSDNVFCLRKESELIVSENSAKNIHWALTGVWNRKCWSIFSGLKDMLKISYGCKEDCLSLHQKIQDIQKLQLQIEILNCLKNSLPFLSGLQNDHVALAQIYKSYSAMCNISSVLVPVLLKS